MNPIRVPRQKFQTITRALTVALVSALAYCGVAGTVTVIPAGGTLRIGGTASEPNGCNKQGNFIVFEPGSTLVLTQLNSGATIWSTLVATNGAAYLRAELGTGAQPSIQGHVFVCGAGSLTLQGISTARLGHSMFFPVCDLSNLHADATFSNLSVNQSTVLSFPKDVDFPWNFSSDAEVRLMGTEDMLSGSELAVTRGRIYLCNDTAVPAGKTVRVSDKGTLVVQPLRFKTSDGFASPEALTELKNYGAPATNALTLGCSLAMEERPLVFTNAGPVTLTGNLSGSGRLELSHTADVTLSGDNTGAQQAIIPVVEGPSLVLGHAHAASGMTVQPQLPLTVRGAEGLSAVSVKEIVNGESTEICSLVAAANQTLTVNRLAGNVHARGEGSGSVVAFGTLEANARILSDGTAAVRYGDSNTPPAGAATADMPGGEQLVVIPSEGCVDASLLAATQSRAYPALCYDIPAGASVVAGTASVPLRAPQTGTVTLKVDDNETFYVVGEGTFAVTNRTSLADRVSYWYDFSRPETCFRIGEGTTDAYLNNNFGTGVPYVERTVDWRQPEAYYSLWNRRLYAKNGTLDYVATVYPVLFSNGPGGLSYLSCEGAGSSRRLPFSQPTGYNTNTPIPVQLLVMVFGSQKGGGYALVGTQNGALGRSGTSVTSGITTNTAYDIWLDGSRVADPTTQALNGSWQVISIALDGTPFTGLGMLSDVWVNASRGGQFYGEVLLFTNAVSTQVRLEAEQYLAKKWGLMAQYAPAAQAELAGLVQNSAYRVKAAGTPTIVGDDRSLEVSGAFRGTVRLTGGTFRVPNSRLPYTEAEIPSANRLYWADPDDASTVFSVGSRKTEVRVLQDKGTHTFETGKPQMVGLGTRMPYLAPGARGFGPVRTWLDFNNGRVADTNGNNLRFWVLPAVDNITAWMNSLESLSAGTVASFPVQTAFFVQDSLRGGGNPLLSGSGYTDSGVHVRSAQTHTQTIWPDNRPAAFAQGENRLNGEASDYREGFTGLPEVFTLRATSPCNTPFVGYYMNSEGVANGEIMGEMLFYSGTLSDEDVLGIEAYLMGKWLGTLPEGFADVRGAMVTGTGRVEVAQAAQRPNIDPAFEGTVSIAAGENLTMTVNPETGKVEGALNCPLATLSLPATCTLTVDLTAVPATSGEMQSFVLVDCAQYASPVAWTLVKGANAPRRARFVQQGNQVAFRILAAGFVVNLR